MNFDYRVYNLVFFCFQVHQHVRHAKKNLVSRQVITEHFIPDDLPGGVWKVSKTRDVSTCYWHMYL